MKKNYTCGIHLPSPVLMLVEHGISVLQLSDCKSPLVGVNVIGKTIDVMAISVASVHSRGRNSMLFGIPTRDKDCYSCPYPAAL